MQFTPEVKAQWLADHDADRAFIESIDPSPDTAAMQQRITELEQEVGLLSGKLVATRDALATATTALAAATTAAA